jgi:hypothetical protein
MKCTLIHIKPNKQAKTIKEKQARGKKPIMEVVPKVSKRPTYTNTSHHTGINNIHHYGEVFQLIKDGIGLFNTSKRNKR